MLSRDTSRPRGCAGFDRRRMLAAVVLLVLLAAACSTQEDDSGAEAGGTASTTLVSTVSEPVTTTSTPALGEPATVTSTAVSGTAPAASDPVQSVPTTVTSVAGEDRSDDPDNEDEVDPVEEAGAVDGTDGNSVAPEATVRWIECEFEGLECGVVTVPLDYRDRDAGELALTIAVHRATDPDRRIGYLVVNPGGPGASGVDMAAWALEGPGVVFTRPLLERFDIVGFDPRGVERSEPRFVCGKPGAQIELLSQVELPFDTAKEFAAAEEAALLCVESMGAAAGLLHSEYVARDIDEIRKALGAERISYFGASYGATLGVWYATLFPESVRAMVVDGADNPVDDVSTVEARVANVIDELRQFEVLLGEALDACDRPECPIYNDGDPRGYYKENVGALEAVAEATGGNPLAGALSIITPLYSEESWPYLWLGYALLVEDGDPSLLAEFALFQLGDSGGGTTFVEHVNCLDSWVLNPQLDRHVRLSDEEAMEEAVHRELPLLANLDFAAPGTCPFYDLLDRSSFGGTLDGSDVPIVVIGNPRDPATPFTESQELVEETLSNGYLVRAEHYAHVVYPSNECANEIIHRALIDLVLPEERTTIC
ncbi:MAG: alpha/beta fold hydrolase [Acidimicrobiia bacterium]|nr:alpha/beta fold hydrolase [Acidimicrobiia bacterium]MYC84012.1 alpha/beta fold hydrolase [Acidimicrobiia bacterium]